MHSKNRKRGSCSYGGGRVYLTIDPTIPVMCPNCTAIRKINKAQWKQDAFIYPRHDAITNTTSTASTYYKFDKGRGWILVINGEEKELSYEEKHSREQRKWVNFLVSDTPRTHLLEEE